MQRQKCRLLLTSRNVEPGSSQNGCSLLDDVTRGIRCVLDSFQELMMAGQIRLTACHCDLRAMIKQVLEIPRESYTCSNQSLP